MMKKKILVTGLMVATMMTISACGSNNTTAETTTAAEITTVAETTTEEETILAETITEAGAESEAAGELTSEQIKEFAEDIRQVVANKDMEWLADMCAYPVYVGLGENEGSEIADREAFMELGSEDVFTDELLETIEAVNSEELEMVGAGVIMGGDVNITFNNVDGAPAITGINIQK